MVKATQTERARILDTVQTTGKSFRQVRIREGWWYDAYWTNKGGQAQTAALMEKHGLLFSRGNIRVNGKRISSKRPAGHQAQGWLLTSDLVPK